MRRRRLVVIVLALSALLAISGQVFAIEPAFPTPSPGEIDADRSFREAFGLASDTGSILRVRTSPDADTAAFGFPVTPGERARIFRDDAIIQRTDRLADLVAGNRDAFGGVWITRGSSVVVHVAMTRDNAALATAARDAAPDGAALDMIARVQSASNAAMESLAARIVDEYGPVLARLGASVGPDPVSGTVVVGTPEPAGPVAHSIKDSYGYGVTIQEQAPISLSACTSRRDCTNPFTGGMSLRPTGYPSSYDHWGSRQVAWKSAQAASRQCMVERGPAEQSSTMPPQAPRRPRTSVGTEAPLQLLGGGGVEERDGVVR